jgi:hypothetical protein
VHTVGTVLLPAIRPARSVVVLLAAALLALAPAVSNAPAAHAATWTASPGGSFTATSSSFTMTNERNGGSIVRCQSATLNGTVPVAGSGLSGTGIVRFTGGQFTNCTGPFGVPCTVTVVGTWSLDAVSYNGSGVTIGKLTNVVIVLTCGSCTVQLAGSADVTYDNGTGVLRIVSNGGLVVSSASSGCLGTMVTGDRVWLDISFIIRPPIILTSP